MKKYIFKFTAVAIAAVLNICTLMPVMAETGYSSKNQNDMEAVDDALTNADIIDYAKKGSLTIRKYDMTAAAKIGNLEAIDTENTAFSSGEQNAEAEKAFKKFEIKGVEFTYVNLGQIETSSKTIEGKSNVKVVYEIDSELRTILGLDGSEPENMNASNEENKCGSDKFHYTASTLQAALKATNEQGVVAKDKLEAYVIKHGTAMELTDKDGLTKAENLELGLYLVVETKVPEQVTSTVDPWMVSIPMTHSDGGSWFYDVHVYPKNQTGNPTLEKLVRNAPGPNATDGSNTVQNKSYLVSEYEKTDKFVEDRKEYSYDCSTTASEGDILDYIIVSKLPHITSASTYLTQYQFVDTLSKGIEYEKDSVQIALYASMNDLTKPDAVWNVSSDKKLATVKTSAIKNDSSSLTVTMTETGLREINTKYSDYYMVVYYQAKVNSDATAVLGDEGNPNDVHLTWKRTSAGFYDTLEDKAVVFTYGVDITKNFSDDKGNAENVKFTLYNDTDGYYVVADESETDGNNKIYYVTGKTAVESEATHFVPNAGGKLQVYGIEGDKYVITEITTDHKYSLLKDPIIIDIKAATQDIQSAVAGWDGMMLNDADKLNTTSGDGRPAGKIAMSESEVVSATATVDGNKVDLGKYNTSQNAIVGLSVLNSKTWFMPQTGGYGIRLLPVIGIMIAVVGIVITRKKKDNKQA